MASYPKQASTHELRQRIFTSIDKLSDRATFSQASTELNYLAKTLPFDYLPTFLSCILAVDSSSKSPVRVLCISLLSVLNQTHKATLSPHLSKIIPFLLRRLRDLDTSVRNACIGVVSSFSELNYLNMLEPFLGSISIEQDMNAQMGCCLCLKAAIDSGAVEERDEEDLRKRVLPKVLKLLKGEGFKAKGALLGVVESVVEVNDGVVVNGSRNGGSLVANVVGVVVEMLSSDDWMARKSAAEVLLKMAVVVDEQFAAEVKCFVVNSLDSRRFDKVKITREIMNRALEAWREVPGGPEEEFALSRSNSSVSKESGTAGGASPAIPKRFSYAGTETPKPKKAMAKCRSSLSDGPVATTSPSMSPSTQDSIGLETPQRRKTLLKSRSSLSDDSIITDSSSVSNSYHDVSFDSAQSKKPISKGRSLLPSKANDKKSTLYQNIEPRKSSDWKTDVTAPPLSVKVVSDEMSCNFVKKTSDERVPNVNAFKPGSRVVPYAEEVEHRGLGFDGLTCSALHYAKKSCHSQEESVMEFMQDAESNSAKHAEKIPLEEKKLDHFLPSFKVVVDTMQGDDQETDREAPTLEGSSNGSSCCASDLNGQKLSGDVHDDDNQEEQVQCKEACLDFQNSHVDVNTIDSEPHFENKDDESSVSASKWPEHDESLALWVKWRGKWQAGIKCERIDWPLATVKAKPTHDRKSYIVIFFPHKKNYSWADTLLVCAIDELPQPIVHRSHRVGVQLVEDLTVARRFIMKKLVIGIMNIVDQLPVQVLVETARDLVVWREFAAEAFCCKSYPDLGRLLLKLQSMVLQQYIDANWMQHSFQLWVEKCQNAVSADYIEILKEELVDSILWSEISDLRDAQGQQPALGCEWKLWKHEFMKSYSMTQSVSGVGGIEQPCQNDMEDFSISPSITGLQISRKRPKLEVRRAEPHNSAGEIKSCHENTVPEIDSSFFTGQSIMNVDNALVPSKEELIGQEIEQTTSPSNAMDRWDGDHVIVVDTLNAESTQNEDSNLQPVKGAAETKSAASKVKSRQCIAFIEAKGRRCVRWANDGDEFCCVHVASRFAAQSVKPEATSPAESSMCQGTTTQGTRCKHRSLPGTSFCKKHRSHADGTIAPSSPGSQLKRKHDELLDKSEHPSKDIVLAGEAERPFEGRLTTLMEGTISNGRKSELTMPELAEDSNCKNLEIAYCVGLGMDEGHSNCLESPKRHSLYCEKHIPSWLKRARNGKSRIISKEVFVDLLRTCSSQMQKTHLHKACDIFYKLLKSILSMRNQVPKEIQFQWALSEASKDSRIAELLMKLVSTEKERLTRIWGFDLDKGAVMSCTPVVDQALVPVEEEADDDGSFKCKICSDKFSDDQTLGTHWIDSHNKEAQWLFRGYACAICLDSFTNRKVLETHVQERHHAQFVEHCMLIQCIPCGSHFGNSEELWSHVLSAHTEGFRQSKKGHNVHQFVNSQQKPDPSKPASLDNSEGQSSIRKFICRFCGLRFDLLPDLGRHHQAAHMGPGLASSHPKKKGLRYFAYRLKSGRLSRPRFKKGLVGASYRLRNKGSIGLKKRLQPVNSMGAEGINSETADLVRLTEAQCSAIAKMLSSEAQKTRARPSNNELLSVARFACCKVSVQRSLEQKYGELPERLYLKAAKLCSEHNTPVDWHRQGFNCSKGCQPQEDCTLGFVLSCPVSERGALDSPSPTPQQGECEMDECHFVINPQYFRWRHLLTTIILCDDISFGQERVSVPCVVDKNLIDSLHNPTYGFDGQIIYMPWESFTYATKPLLDKSLDFNMQNLQLGCGCSQPTCCPETCDHVYLFNNDFEYAKDIDGKLIEERFPYDDKGRLVLEENHLIYECNHLCKCSSKCPNRVLQNGVQVKMEVCKTVKKGWAVRTCEKISRGTFVCEFVGEVLDEQEAIRRRKRSRKEGCDYFYDMGIHMKHLSELTEGKAKYFIDATKFGNVSRFINHSCCPNLESHLVLVESMDFRLAHVGFYAKQDISAGEELCFDFRYELQAGDGCPCLCGASTCRGRLH